MGCHNPVLVAVSCIDSVKTIVEWINTTAQYFPPRKESKWKVIFKLYDYQQLSPKKGNRTDRHSATLEECMTVGHSNEITVLSHVNITSPAASSSKETDLKGILSHGSCLFP